MSAEVVAFGPSMVDICAPLDETQYQKCHEILGVEPGGWKLIECPDEADQLLDLLQVKDYDTKSSRKASLSNSFSPVAAAGSSTLGMLGAMPPAIRSESTLVTALATKNGHLDDLSSYFAERVRENRINHDYTLIEGRNPVGFVLYDQADAQNGEKTLAMHPGVAQRLDTYDALADKDPALVLIDTYELKSGELSVLLDKIIVENRHRVALSLGNHTLLANNTNLRQQVRNYVESGFVTALCGNEQEYQTLYPELDPWQTDQHSFGGHPVGGMVPYVLMTRGSEGMDALWGGDYTHVSAHDVDGGAIVNTSGAGDTAMGVFCGGIVEGLPAFDTLSKAAYYAGKVLQRSSSMILARD